MRLARSLGDAAFQFVLAMGIVNLFADLTYEGGGSINGAFLGSLGASAAAISIIAGAGEFLGYGLRVFAGYLADKTGRHWLLTFVGYTINLLAVPAMAFAGSWQAAAALVLAERVGRALRKPTVEAMLSYTTGKHGRGWVYAVNTALDEIGATVGPLVMLFNGSYRFAYAVLLISALLALLSLGAARLRFPMPSHFEAGARAAAQDFTLPYWLFMVAGACFAIGLMSYELLSFHLTAMKIASATGAPVLLAFATGSGVVASLIMGRCYDRFGLPVVLIAVILSALFTPLLFAGTFAMVIAAMPLLGIGYAVQDTLLKAIVAGVLPHGRRHLAFGLFYSGYGCGWLIGSVGMGVLYARSWVALQLVAVLAQLASVPLFVLAQHRKGRQAGARQRG